MTRQAGPGERRTLGLEARGQPEIPGNGARVKTRTSRRGRIRTKVPRAGRELRGTQEGEAEGSGKGARTKGNPPAQNPTDHPRRARG